MLNRLDAFRAVQARVLRLADRVADALGLFQRPLLPGAVIDLAHQQTGLSDFGDRSFEEPLSVLLRAYEQEANLSAFGRIAARWDMVRFLSNLLRLREEEKRDRTIRAERIRRPIFIMGLPRSGTTFLHSLMALDPGNRVPRCWQTIYPYPMPEHTARGRDARSQQVARQFANFLRVAPELPMLHPLEADAPQECIEITGQVLRSMRFDTTHYVPSYERWLDRTGHVEAYRFHKRFLQHLQHQCGPEQWVLKSPDHIFAFDALREVYPDARFVFVHRDPMRVLASVARLTEILRRPFTRQVNRGQIGLQVSDRWARGAKLLIEASEHMRAWPERILHLRYCDLVRDPLAAMTAIYRHFGLTLSNRVELQLRTWLERRPTGGYGSNSYRYEDYGLNPAVERKRFGAYTDHFCTEAEGFGPVASNSAIPMAV